MTLLRGQNSRNWLPRSAIYTFVRIGNTHAKILIKDHEFAAITSFNWLYPPEEIRAKHIEMNKAYCYKEEILWTANSRRL